MVEADAAAESAAYVDCGEAFDAPCCCGACAADTLPFCAIELVRMPLVTLLAAFAALIGCCGAATTFLNIGFSRRIGRRPQPTSSSSPVAACATSISVSSTSNRLFREEL